MLERLTAALCAAALLTGAAAAETYTPILVDGAVDDWATVPIAHQDPSGDHGNAPFRNGERDIVQHRQHRRSVLVRF